VTTYRTTKLAFWGAVLLAAEITLLDRWAVLGARPEALLALACFAALFARDSAQGLLAAWVVGLLKDLGSVGPLGFHALLFLAAGAVVLQVRQILFRESPLTQVAVAFLATCWVQAIGALFVALVAGPIPLGVFLVRTLVSAALTAVFMPFLPLFLTRARWVLR
jgi:rod shape-determining protein MreD